MKNLKMKYKLTVILTVFLVSIVLTSVMGIYGMYTINLSEIRQSQVSENLVYAGELDSIVLKLRLNLRRIVIDIEDSARTEELIQEMVEYEDEFTVLLNGLRSSELVAEDTASMALMADIEEKFNRLVADHQSFYDSARLGQRDSLLEWMTVNANRHSEIQAECDALTQNGLLFSQNLTRQDTFKATALIASTLFVSVCAVLLFLFMGKYISHIMVQPLEKIAQAAGRLALGDVNVTVESDRQDEIGMVCDAFEEMIGAMQKQAEMVSEISEGNYAVSIPLRSDVDIVNRSLNSLVERANNMLVVTQEASAQVAAASSQISDLAQNMAAGCSEQSASVVQFSSTIDQVVEEAKANASSADDALKTTVETNQLLEGSIDSMGRVLEAMNEIRESAKSVANVIKAIEDIAFQTNILALNASVEAARAGSYGKGFSVVADEVRQLAAKSAAAAQDTTALIDTSIRCVEEGDTIVRETDENLNSVVDRFATSLAFIRQITDSSRQQLDSLSLAEAGMEQMSAVVQENSVTSEETAASAEEMASQADALKNLLVGLRLKDNHSSAGNALPAYSFADAKSIRQ